MNRDFSRPRQAETIWQRLQIETNWEHHSRSSGQRFLGSVRIPREKSEELLDITAQNLARVRPLTFDRLYERFDAADPQRYWIRIITLALSEYAYYSEGNAGFWQGVCDRLNLQNTQGVQNALREIVRQGSDLLELRVIKDKRNGGVRCVSTLCLQSGIPQQNLSHFAQLLEELARQYDWWDIAHAEPEDLSQLLYEFCQQNHPQWGKLLTFLESSCTDSNEEAEPVSGELLQGLAVVAQALERQGLEPAVLQDVHQREQLLQNFCLPNTFFLRSWDNLIQVLTPQEEHSIYRRKLVSLRKKPLLLRLDVADSMDIQLVLSGQMLWQPDWQNLRGTYVQIQEHGWETTLPRDGALEIPELKLPIYNIAEEWIWHLRSHTNRSLVEWLCQGVAQDFSVLIFDAWTGDRLIPPNGLKGKTEIICFYDSTIQLEISKDIELIDSFVPCSISGWRGQQLQLISEKAQITFSAAQSTQTIEWDNSQTNYPQLRGIKLKCKESTYLEVPSIWYLPTTQDKTLNIQIEDIENRQVLTDSHEVRLSINSNWQQIALSRWINQSGTYVVKLSSRSERWSEKFELKSNFSLEQSRPISSIQVCDRTNHSIEVPRQISSSGEFWLEELTLRNLWTLEEVSFLLSNGQESYKFVRQANISGILFLNLAVLRDVLPESSWYGLSYQRSGGERCSLLEISTGESVRYTWTQQAIHLSGLRSGQSYTLSLWNLLRPEQPSLSLQLENSQEYYTVPLQDLLSNNLGIFYVELKNSITSPQSLGWWSNIQDNKNLILPDELDNGYCFNILDNEALEEFCDFFKEINLKIDCEHIRRGIPSLQSCEGYLPDWLDQSMLLKKVQNILPPSIPPITILPDPSPSKPQNLTYSLNIKNDNCVIRKAFCKRFSDQLKKAGLEQSIQLIKDPVLRDLLRVQIEDQHYLPRLKSILTDLESALHTSIRLIEWR
jgi:hypothetical protein